MVNRQLCVYSCVVLLFASLAMADESATPLFDGKSLDGWEKKGGAATYVVENDEIVGTSAPDTTNTFLCTVKRYGDFVLTYEFKCEAGLNSGVQFRSECYDEDTTVEQNGQTKKFAAGDVHGYQAEIDPDKPQRMWAGGVYDQSRRGWLFPGKLGGDESTFTEKGKSIYIHGEWNIARVECRGDHIQTWLNGEPRADFHDDYTHKGFIGLQVHSVGDKADPMRVSWRNIQIQELTNQP